MLSVHSPVRWSLNGAGIRHTGSNLTVRHAYFHDSDNGILTWKSPDGVIVIEYSEFARNGYGDGQSHNVYIGGTERLEFRYNYSHDNNFAFAIMRKFGQGIYIHHNISVNERHGFMHYGFYADHAISDVIVSNNTFYSTYSDMMMFMNFGPLREPIDTTYVDNIFVFAGEGATWGSLPTEERGNIFENNLVVGLEDPDYITLTDDPLLVSPGAGGTEIDMKDPDRLDGFRLCAGSPAIGAGRTDGVESEYDFWGDAITRENIGAYGSEGVECNE